MTDIHERIHALQKSGEAAAAHAKALLDSRTDPTDEDRELIAKGLADVSQAAKLAEGLVLTQERIRRSEETKAALAAIGVDLGLGMDPSLTAKQGLGVTRASGSRSRNWATAATDAVKSMGSRVGVADGVKALISGTISAPNLLDQGRPVEIDYAPTTLIDLIGRGTPAGERVGNKFQYLRQTSRVNNAGAIPDGVNKPVSTFGFGEVTDHYRIFANKTEDLPYRYLNDYDALIDVVKEQLADNVLQVIEEQILSGTGPDTEDQTDDFVGILNTSSIQTQAYTSSVLQTLSNAKYKFITQERPFNGWVMNPSDLQALELLREDGSTGPFLFPSRQAISDFLGAPVVPSAGITAGTTLVGDFKQAELIPLGDDELIVDAGKRTVNNTFLIMYEGTYGFRVKKPNAFVSVDLTA